MTDTSINQSAGQTPSTPRITLHGPGEIVDMVPYLLGFHPTDSLVLVGISEATVVVTARVDLVEVTRTTLTELVDTLSRRGRCTQAIAVIYSDDRPAADRLPAAIDAAADTADVSVLDHLLVTSGRWISLACTDPDCCPPEGTALQHAGQVATAAVYAGLRVLADRDALTAIFTPAPARPDLAAALKHHYEGELEAVLRGDAECYHRSVTRALFAAHRAAQAGQLPSDDQVARFGVGMQSYPVRDALWLAIDDRRLPGLELWANLARRLPDPYAAAPLFLAAWCAYRDGNGAVAGIAAEKALQSDPDYSAAELLLAALARGINPRTLPPLRAPKGDTTTH